MNLNKVLEVMESTKNGTFGTIEYKTSVPVNKEAKKAGVQIFCQTRKMVRFGADYKNLTDGSDTASTTPKTNNYSWVIKNKVSHNSNTGKDYIRVSNINRKTIERVYSIVVGGNVQTTDSLSAAEQFLQPSYLKSKAAPKPVVQNIAVDNIISINGIVG